jgi:hypothetical protein
MVDEVLQTLAPQPGEVFVDSTVGAGGHAEAVLEAASPGGLLLGIDADPHALSVARARLAPFGDAAILLEGNFRDIGAICREHGFAPVHGVLFDLGLSSMQLSDEARGFSFQTEAPLDMRFSPQQSLTAADIVNTYPEQELRCLLWRNAERQPPCPTHRLRTAAEHNAELARVVQRAVGRRPPSHPPATRTFLALRIAVNEEMENLSAGPRSGARPPGPRRAPGRHQLSFAGRHDRQGFPASRDARLHLPPRYTRLHLRPQGRPAPGHPWRPPSSRRRGGPEPAQPERPVACGREALIVATRAHAHPAAPARERAAPRSEGRQPGLPSLVIVCVMVIGVAGLLPLLLSSEVIHTSGDVRQLEGVRNDWNARNQELEAEIAVLGSLDRIEKEARERLGMVPPEETIYLTVDQPAPEKQIVPLRFLLPEKRQSQDDESWWESILGLFHLP